MTDASLAAAADKDLESLKYGVEHLTHLPESQTPSIWDLIQSKATDFVSSAIDQANAGLAVGADAAGSLRQRLVQMLQSPLNGLPAWHSMDAGNVSVNEEVDGAVSEVVRQAVGSLNLTTNTTEFQDKLVKVLDREIEIDVMNTVIKNASRAVEEGDTDFFHNLPFKDETMFVALMCMGIILPIIFITLFLVFFYKRRKENAERRQEMLLQDQPEFSMDEYNADRADGRLDGDEEVPDLVLKNYSV